MYLRFSPPNLHRALVEMGDESIGVTSVRRRRQNLQQATEMGIALVVEDGFDLLRLNDYLHRLSPSGVARPIPEEGAGWHGNSLF
jgi:hypothetical protein